MPPTHRPYQPSDRGACVDLFETNLPRFFDPSERSAFTEFLDAAENRCELVFVGDALVGCGGFTLSGDGQAANLCWGMICRDQHRQGLGSFLLRLRLQAIAQSTTVRSVRLATSPHSQRFYERHGFTVQSVRRNGLAPGLDEVEMQQTTAGMLHRVEAVLAGEVQTKGAARGSPF